MADRAVAVLQLARSLGLDCDVLVPLRSTNNSVFALRECAVVAKVHDSDAAAAHELVLGHALASVGAPIVAPAAGVGDEVRGDAGLHVTFWVYAAEGDTRPSSAAIAGALGELHRHLAGLADLVADRRVEAQLDDARRALQSPALAPVLDPADRHLLDDALNRAVVDARHWPRAVIHGSPHRMNILTIGGAPVFIDLETIELGPIEWDLAHLEAEVAQAYPEPVDGDVLAWCRTAVSAATAAWCFAGLDRGPDMRAHAEHHLAVVRSAR
jgi:hypothetical protein